MVVAESSTAADKDSDTLASSSAISSYIRCFILEREVACCGVSYGSIGCQSPSTHTVGDDRELAFELQ